MNDFMKERLSRVLRMLGISRSQFKQRSVEKILSSKTEKFNFDSNDVFNELQGLYAPRDSYKYDADSLLKRGNERCKEFLDKYEGLQSGNFKVLEVGCGDGMTGFAFSSCGQNVTLVDNKDWRDERAKGLNFLKANMNSRLPLENESFDLVISYNAFEHFNDPVNAFNEIFRVCKKSGMMYFNFGPLYSSPWGLHAYRTILMPYAQFLFSKQFLQRKFKDLKICDLGKEREALQPLNEWKVEQFKSLFSDNDLLDLLEFVRSKEDSCLDIIKKYPRAFQGIGLTYEDVITQGLTVSIKKQ